MQTDTTYYPISTDEIKTKISKKITIELNAVIAE
jgi:hypothetical protein